MGNFKYETKEIFCQKILIFGINILYINIIAFYLYKRMGQAIM